MKFCKKSTLVTLENFHQITIPFVQVKKVSERHTHMVIGKELMRSSALVFFGMRSIQTTFNKEL
jgi:hypothetical protein